jgi:3-deoxy-manno-octulosonate cytidylyltransferase (CMP-KDO synthetase)
VSFTVLIPARLASSRLPHKPLADIHGKPMVVRVADQALRSGAQRVVVACDDARIAAACASHQVQAILTRADHASGTDRVAEAAQHLGLAEDEIVVNVQGDEPLIDPTVISQCAALLQARPQCGMATVAYGIENPADFANPNVVKLVCNQAGEAMYFSRAPIPHWRDAPGEGGLPAPAPLRHVGLYAYRAGFLKRFTQLPPAPLEQLEALEQLRALWHGERIAVMVSDATPAPGVDTPQDLEKVRVLFSKRV